MHFTQLSVIAAGACLLAACGSSGDSAAITQAKAALSNDNATAAQVALAKRGGVHCPATIKTPPRAAGTPVDDIKGVRPGLTYEEAVNVIECSNPLLVVHPEGDGFQFQQYGYKVRQSFEARNAKAAHTHTQQEYLQNWDEIMSTAMKPGDERWEISTMGLPGKERVIAVWRDQWFATGKNPTVEAVKAALIHKYGQPTRVNANSTFLSWVYDARGARVPDTWGAAHTGPDIHLDSRTSGISIAAEIDGMSSNQALADKVIVSVQDSGGGYAALIATEKGLKAMDAKRRAAEVQKAAKNSQAPKF